MITLPVTAQMYHSLVQQQIPSNENTVCVTPMQVQNLVTNNVCTNISNSNFNPSTTYVMSTSNRNVINFPFHGTAVGHIKGAISNNHSSAVIQKCNSMQNHALVKKTFYKKKILNLSKDTQKSLKIEFKKNLNNNLDVIKNRNSSQADMKEVSNHEDVDEKSERLKRLLTDDVKKEET